MASPFDFLRENTGTPPPNQVPNQFTPKPSLRDTLLNNTPVVQTIVEEYDREIEEEQASGFSESDIRRIFREELEYFFKDKIVIKKDDNGSQIMLNVGGSKFLGELFLSE